MDAALKISFVLFFASTASSLNLPANRTLTKTPVFSTQYTVRGIILLPYAEIQEPFSAYYDAPTEKSRVDYYGDLVQTIQRADLKSEGNQGVNYKLAYSVDPSGSPERVCFRLNGTAEARVAVTTVLPDLTTFHLAGMVPCPDYYHTGARSTCEVWEYVFTVGDKVNKYAFWLRREPNSGQEPIPVAYLMKGYDSLLGSHFDKYEVYYRDYSTQGADPSTYDVDGLNVTCRGFPGPGVQVNTFHNPIDEFIAPRGGAFPEHHEQGFQRFKGHHGKKYDNEADERLAQHTFIQNSRYVDSSNRANLHYKMAINHLADLDFGQTKHLRGRLYTPGYNGGLPFEEEENEVALDGEAGGVPEQLDWRLMGAVTPVKDQAICGSCWSFGTVGTIEGNYFVKSGHLVRLSQQQLVDCSWQQGDNGCDGGEDFRAYDYIMKAGGLATEDDYGPYLGQDGMCTDRSVQKTVKLTGFVNVTAGEPDALRLALFKNGPVTVAIDASHKSLSFYSSGVYFEPKCGNKPEDLDHSVLAVGYGTLMGQKYWLIKNSWSTYWGNDGYVLMSQKDNNCGVMTDATFPLIE